jgi:ferredoxin
MKRRIIKIDRHKCNGCGACAAACHEGAIEMIDGTAVLTREDYCDGLGDCLPACPTGAITFEMREAPAYDEAAVLAAKKNKETMPAEAAFVPSQLSNFPVQIKLVPPNAPYFDGADLLIAADCTAFSYGNFHREFMRNRVAMIGCPKLDAVNYADKLTQIFANNTIRSVTVARMTVPCCGVLPFAVKTAVEASGKKIPVYVSTINPKGEIV